MKEILDNWCKTGSLSMEEAVMILSEYLSLDGRQASPEMLQMIIAVSQFQAPINWFRLIGTIYKEKYNMTLVNVESVPDRNRNRRSLYRFTY